MSKKKDHADELRRRAEELFAARDSRIESLGRADLASLAHELAVHQIELEIQNEELRRAQLQAEEARDRYLDLYDFAPVGYFTLDEHNRIVEANLTGCRLLNARRRDLLNKRFTKFIPDQEADKFYFHRKQVLESGTRQTCELRIQETDGAAFEARLESIRAAEDRLRVAVTDVTERKRAEEALHELNVTLENKVAQRTAQLEHRTRQLQRLTLELSQVEERERRRIAIILHEDLQQQIAAAKFHVSRLKGWVAHNLPQREIGEKVDEMLKTAIETSRSLSHDLSPAVLHMDDLTEVLRWLANRVRVQHGLTVHVETSGQVNLESEAMTIFLFRVAQEMLFNVVKHAQVGEARIRIRRRGRCICMSVSDRGRGFDPQTLKETAGLGLLSVRERVEMLGGRMKIRSRQGKGSTFQIVVPDEEVVGIDVERDREPADRVMGGKQGQDQDNSRLRVLLADDHRIVREGIAALLAEEDDVEVVAEAATGRDAVDLANRLHPDVVVMDVSMPLISGDEATRQIKAYFPQIRIVALSMYGDGEMMDRMHRAGAEAYVLKTAPSEELLAAIRGTGAGSP